MALQKGDKIKLKDGTKAVVVEVMLNRVDVQIKDEVVSISPEFIVDADKSDE